MLVVWEMLLQMGIIQVVPLLPWASFSFPAPIRLIYCLPKFLFLFFSDVLHFDSVGVSECDPPAKRESCLSNLYLLYSSQFPVIQLLTAILLFPRTKGGHTPVEKRL